MNTGQLRLQSSVHALGGFGSLEISKLLLQLRDGLNITEAIFVHYIPAVLERAVVFLQSLFGRSVFRTRLFDARDGFAILLNGQLETLASILTLARLHSSFFQLGAEILDLSL